MNLADWRKRSGHTLDFVADAVGVSAMSISRIEKGAQRPSPELAEHLEALTKGQVSAASLVGLSEKKKPRRGLREDSTSFESASALTVEVRLPPERAKVLKSAGVDIPEVARAGAEKALKEAEAKAWADANREAIEASRRWIEKRGTFAEELDLI